MEVTAWGSRPLDTDAVHARMEPVRVAIVVYDGVLDAECEAFSSVLGAMDDAEIMLVGARLSGNVITCEGRISAVDAAFEIVERLYGSLAVERIRVTLLARGEPHLRAVPWWLRPAGWARSVAGRRTLDAVEARLAHPDEPPVTPLSVMVELLDNEHLARQMKRSSLRRR
jgi:hypothetical protein